MKTSNFAFERTVSGPTVHDKTERVATVTAASDERVSFTVGESLNNLFSYALNPDTALFEGVVSMFFNDAIAPEVISNAAKNLTSENVLRFVDDDAIEVHPVTRSPFTVDGWEIEEVAELWKTAKNGKPYVKGKRFVLTIEDNEETWDLTTDRSGHVQPKTYGIGALYKMLQKPLSNYALKEAEGIRTDTGAFCRVSYNLRKLAEGEAKQSNK